MELSHSKTNTTTYLLAQPVKRTRDQNSLAPAALAVLHEAHKHHARVTFDLYTRVQCLNSI